jgi:hypothetical protein
MQAQQLLQNVVINPTCSMINTRNSPTGLSSRAGKSFMPLPQTQLPEVLPHLLTG